MTITEVASALGVTRKHVSVAFATEAEFWVNLQAQHDLWTVRRKLGKAKMKSLVSRKAT